jgi:hypothetical protein
VPAAQFGYLVEEGFLYVGRMAGDQFEQGHDVMAGVALQKGIERIRGERDGLGMADAVPVHRVCIGM